VQAFCAAQPKFKEFLSPFTDAFRVSLEPVVFIVRDDVTSKFAGNSAILSFRDLVAMCVVPYARSLSLVYGTGNHIMYSNSFYPPAIRASDHGYPPQGSALQRENWRLAD
jgi:hypothetical protein